MFKTFAYFGQIVLPFCFLLGALMSGIKQGRRTKLYKSMEAESATMSLNSRDGIDNNPLNRMSWSDFEQLIAEFFTRNGFDVQDTPPGPDGGIDLLLMKNGKKFIVQCKHWKKFKVNVQTIREQFGIMHAEGAHGVYVVTSGVFTEDAVQFAEGKNIKLIDGSKLKTIIRKQEKNVENDNRYQVPIPSPQCPICSSGMKKRTAKRGIRSGQDFWGCSRFPKCKGTLSE